MPFRRVGNIYKCFYCYKNFNKASDLREHTKSHGDINQKFRTVKRCGIKTSVNLDVNELKCNRCDSDYDTLKELLVHLNEDHNEIYALEALKHINCYKLSDGDMKCLICNEVFNYFFPLMLHTLRIHKVRQLKCAICNVSFSNKGSLAKHHQNVHETNPEIYKCRHCEKEFTALHKRKDHEKRIHNEQARKCPICKEILGSTSKKASHMATVHNIMATEFKCERCPKVFRQQNQLVIHTKRVHLKEKTKGCKVCGEKFFDNQLLGLHMIRHSDAKPFECEICKKRFPRKKSLDIHIRIHTNDKRCVCKVCGEAFVQTASLKLHMRVHHGIEKPQAN